MFDVKRGPVPREAGVLVTLELATGGVGLLCCRGGGFIYITTIPVITLLLG